MDRAVSQLGHSALSPHMSLMYVWNRVFNISHVDGVIGISHVRTSARHAATFSTPQDLSRCFPFCMGQIGNIYRGLGCEPLRCLFHRETM